MGLSNFQEKKLRNTRTSPIPTTHINKTHPSGNAESSSTAAATASTRSPSAPPLWDNARRWSSDTRSRTPLHLCSVRYSYPRSPCSRSSCNRWCRRNTTTDSSLIGSPRVRCASDYVGRAPRSRASRRRRGRSCRRGVGRGWPRDWGRCYWVSAGRRRGRGARSRWPHAARGTTGPCSRTPAKLHSIQVNSK